MKPYVNPAVWVSRSRTVMSRSAVTVRNDSGVPSSHTRRSPSSGRNRETGSSSWNRPSSYSVISATLVIGLVIE